MSKAQHTQKVQSASPVFSLLFQNAHNRLVIIDVFLLLFVCVLFFFVCWIELSNKSYLVISTRELGIPASPGRRRIPQLMNVTIAIIKTSHVFVSSSSPQHLDEKAASIVQDAPSCLSLESGGGVYANRFRLVCVTGNPVTTSLSLLWLVMSFQLFCDWCVLYVLRNEKEK